MAAELDRSTPTASQASTYLQLVATTSFWGSAFVASKVATQAVPATVAAAARFILAGLFMGLFLWTRPREERSFSLRTGGLLALLGLVGVGIYNLFFFVGLAFSRASDGTMIIPTMSPVITVVLAAVFLKERLSWNKVAGLGVALSGSLLFFYAVASAGPADQRRLLGDLLFLGAAVCWSGYTLAGKRVLQRVSPLTANTVTVMVGAMALGLFALPDILQVSWGQVRWSFWAIEAYLAVFPTALANVFWYNGVSRIGAARTAVFMYLVPITGLALAALLLGDLPSPLQLAGAGLMIAGVYLVNRKNG